MRMNCDETDPKIMEHEKEMREDLDKFADEYDEREDGG